MSDFSKLEKYQQALLMPVPHGIKFTAICDLSTGEVSIDSSHSEELKDFFISTYASSFNRIKASGILVLHGTYTLLADEANMVRLTLRHSTNSNPFIHSLSNDCVLSNNISKHMLITSTNGVFEGSILRRLQKLASLGFEVMDYFLYVNGTTTNEEIEGFIGNVENKWEIQGRCKIIPLELEELIV